MTATDPVRTSKIADIVAMMRRSMKTRGDAFGGLELLRDDFVILTPDQLDEFIAELDRTVAPSGETVPLAFDFMHAYVDALFRRLGFTLVTTEGRESCGHRDAKPLLEGARFTSADVLEAGDSEFFVELAGHGLLWMHVVENELMIAPFTGLWLTGYVFGANPTNSSRTVTRQGVEYRNLRLHIDRPSWMKPTSANIHDFDDCGREFTRGHDVDFLLKPDGTITLL